MVRATCSPASRRKRKRILKQAKGFWGDRKNHIRQAKNAVMSALSFSTAHRKLRKREFRSLWVTRIGVAAKINGISYSRLMYGLKMGGSSLNRKMLADMAINDPNGFATVADFAKQSLSAS